MDIIYGLVNKFRLAAIEKAVSKVYKYNLSGLSDSELKIKYEKARAKRDIPYLLALAGEAAYRILGIKPYKEQYMCSYALCSGYIAEMKTGEGKSLSATLAAAVMTTMGKVHIATVNDYLANRDYETMSSVYQMLGITSAVNTRNCNKEEVYKADVVYSSSTELIFDYLRSEIAGNNSFPTDNVIIDEIDFVLMDNANSRFSVSAGREYMPDGSKFVAAKEVCRMLKGMEVNARDFARGIREPKGIHYVYCKANRVSYLTDEGLRFLSNFFKVSDIVSEAFELYTAVLSTLDANLFFERGRDYIVKDGRIILINGANGRMMVNSRLENNLHTALEVKENVPITLKTELEYGMSYQMFFSKYKNMTGLSGTVYDAHNEFEELYGIPTVIIPPHNRIRRMTYDDVLVRTQNDKYDFLVRYLKYHKKPDQPALIVVKDDLTSEVVSGILKQHGIEHKLLNSNYTEKEKEIISSAGKHGNITVATIMAGRGTDILIDSRAEKAGGLLLIGLNRFSNRRIDEQIRGRTARHGRIGRCMFIISADDDIWQYANARQCKRYKKLILSLNPGCYVQNSRKISRLLDEIQENINLQNYRLRKFNFQADIVVESLKEAVLEWKRGLKERKPSDLVEYSDANLLKEIPGFEKDTDIKTLIEKQYRRFGNGTAEALYKNLVDKIVFDEWLIFRRDMEDLRYYLPLYRLDEHQVFAEYIRICNKQFEVFKKRTASIILAYFISAEVESVKWH